MMATAFADYFSALWSRPPFPWQEMLAARVASGKWPMALDLPTAAGKTACIDIALWGLAAQAEEPVWKRTAPRRIWFVVDRRIVVDEAFERARSIAAKLSEARGGPLKEVADRLRQISGTERPLASGRLRGGSLRDDGWARLPSQPAVITSTVDQLGSRLLFRGYGHSSQTAPIFAGLAANDSLILLDEAHLSVPFLQTLRAVERYRGDRWAERPIRTPFVFAVLSATPPTDIAGTDLFPGADRENALDHPELARRINASKPAELLLIKKATNSAEDPLVQAAFRRATAFLRENGRQRVAVIVNRVRTAEAIFHSLCQILGDAFDVVLLTGRLRPFERNRLVERWKPVLKASEPAAPERPVVVVTTQCIEVGADFSFDALVTEAASLDALRQRFGRLNRMGHLESAPAVILAREEDTKAGAVDCVYGTALAECWHLLHDKLAATQGTGNKKRKTVDFGVAALDAHLKAIGDLSPYLAPASNAPLLLPSHLDLLCQTSPRPQVEPDISLYLHGPGRGVAEVRVAWRADLDEARPELWPEIVSMCPPNSAETAAVPLYRLRQWLARPSEEDDHGDVEGALELERETEEDIRPVLLWKGRDRSRVCTQASELGQNDVVILPSSYAMAGLAQSAPDQALGSERLDIWEPTHAGSGKPAALRLQRAVLSQWIDCPPLRALMELAENPAWESDSVREAIDAVLAYHPEGEGDPPPPPDWWLALLEEVRHGRCEQHPAGGLVLRARNARSPQEEEPDLFADDDDLLSAAGKEVGLAVHSTSVERAVGRLANLCLPQEFQDPLEIAAIWHDIGKLDERFQVLLRQGNELAAYSGEPLAKSEQVPDSPAQRRTIRIASGLPEGFRHEMLSLQLTERYLPNGQDADLDDLILHAIASHHGYARPFAPICLDFDPPAVRGEHNRILIDLPKKDRSAWAAHTANSRLSERFWRLTRRFGWWGLAYLEAILRLGDWYGSRWVFEDLPAKATPLLQTTGSRTANLGGTSLVLEGIDGANPLGCLAAVGTLVVLHQSGQREARLAWRRDRIVWHPQLDGLPCNDPKALAQLLAKQLEGGSVSANADEVRLAREREFFKKKAEIQKKRTEIQQRGLRGKQREQAIAQEVMPLERDLQRLRTNWLHALRNSVRSPELALGKNIDCTESEYRAIVEPLFHHATLNDRAALDMLAAFCSTGCLHQGRQDGKLAPTLFGFISGSGHQDFLDTAGQLMEKVSAERLERALFHPWTYEDEGLSMRWDPIEDRRYALMDRDPTANDNKPRTVWMANLLGYRALALFPSAPTLRGLTAVGWGGGREGDPFFTWPLWSEPLDLDTIRSLLLLPELYLGLPDKEALRARGVAIVYRSRRIRVGSGANFKINFTPARAV